MATSLVQTRVDDDLKVRATLIYNQLGMDLSTAIRIFLKRSVMVNGIPFQMTLPPETEVTKSAVSALHEASVQATMNGCADMTLDEINAEISAARG